MLHWIGVSGDNALQSGDALRGHDNRIDCFIGFGRMAAFALHDNFKRIGCGKERTGANGEGSDGSARPIVHAVDFVDAKPFHHAVFAHFEPTTAAFFGWLKDHRHGSIKIAGFGKIFCSPQQHGRVTIMAAGMHHTGGFGGIGQPSGLFYGQRVHIGPQSHDFTLAVGAPFNERHNARTADAGYDFITAKFGKPIGDKL